MLACLPISLCKWTWATHRGTLACRFYDTFFGRTTARAMREDAKNGSTHPLATLTGGLVGCVLRLQQVISIMASAPYLTKMMTWLRRGTRPQIWSYIAAGEPRVSAFAPFWPLGSTMCNKSQD